MPPSDDGAAPATRTITRVQRVPDAFPIVHLEGELPRTDGALSVDGAVERPIHLTRDQLVDLGAEVRTIPFHCVWGWSRPDDTWDGISMGRVLEHVGPIGDHVTVSSASGTYSSCLSIEDAAGGFLAWGRAGAPLAPEHGGPVRFLPPPTHWAYKGVKWADHVRVDDGFVPGFWESKVEDPIGRIPQEVVLP